jgi:sigma-54 dependent transcriptional regulator, acetoin dehydrogenase operon transcriptional activator AcoR
VFEHGEFGGCRRFGGQRVQRQGDQVLLGAVVQIAFDASALTIGGQIRTSGRLSQELPVLIIAIPGCHSSGGQFGEPADAGLGVGRHRAGEPAIPGVQLPALDGLVGSPASRFMSDGGFINGVAHELDRLGCAGVPIRDPISQRVVGVVDLTCWASHSDPLLFALAKTAGSQIEERMKASGHESETALVDAYHQQTWRFPLGVLAIGGDVVLMNRYLRQALDAADRTALLEYAADLLSAKASDAPMAVLPSGTTAKLSVADRAQIGSARTNVVFHIRLSAEITVHRVGIRQPAVTRIPGLAGRSSSWRRSCQQVERCCRDRVWVLLEGEKGSGRAKLAQAVGEYVKPGRVVRVMRVENFSTAGRFVAELVSATDDDDFLLVLADVDAIDEQVLEPIAATTSCATPSSTKEALLPFFTQTVSVPALRHRIEDIEELVPFLLGEVASGAQVRLAPEAMRQWSRLPWPGNVAQLRRVLLETVARQRSGVINADKLPPECRSVTRRKLTQMEALERDAIVRSLEENSGNKLEAALALGMSRATIYRKMNDYGIA